MPHRSQVVARETVSAIRKDLIAKCYGGNIIPQEAFLAVQKVGE